MARAIFKEMVVVNEELERDQVAKANYNLFNDPRMAQLSSQIEDKKILQHFFHRVQNLYQENDAIDQDLKLKGLRFGMSPEEYNQLHC